MRVLFWGTPDFALPTLRAITEEGHTAVGVVTQPDRPAGRGRAPTASPVKQFALQEAIPLLQPERARGEGFAAQLHALRPEISVVVAFGQLLPPPILQLPPFGSINVHASLLPELRGAAPIQWAVIRGHAETGISIMRMEAGLDSGPVLLRTPEPIGADDSAGDLAIRLAEVGAGALVAALALLVLGEATETPQNAALATYAPKLSREAARVDWTLPADEVARWIRGMDPVPGAWTALPGGEPLKLYRARAGAEEGSPGEVLAADPAAGLRVACGRGAVLVREVQPAGKRRMTAVEWARGRGVPVGARLG